MRVPLVAASRCRCRSRRRRPLSLSAALLWLLSVVVVAVLLLLLLLLCARRRRGGGATASHHAVGDDAQLRALLPRVARAFDDGDGRNNGRVVLLVLADWPYRQLALNFVCNLRRLAIRNYLVIALDARTYQLLVAHGANVFLHTRLRSPPSPPASWWWWSARDAAAFGSARFANVTRLKSRVVLRVLRQRYSVLLCDADVALLRAPQRVLLALSRRAQLAVQSDVPAWQPRTPPNHNLNSGLYVARAAPSTVAALEAVVRWAHAVRRSEQKAFNYVLCGAFKQRRLGPGARVGARGCFYAKARTQVALLPTRLFPNGSNRSFWQHASPSLLARVYPRALALHVNYVSGVEEKVRRLRTIGAWFVEQRAANSFRCNVKCI